MMMLIKGCDDGDDDDKGYDDDDDDDDADKGCDYLNLATLVTRASGPTSFICKSFECSNDK